MPQTAQNWAGSLGVLHSATAALAAPARRRLPPAHKPWGSCVGSGSPPSHACEDLQAPAHGNGAAVQAGSAKRQWRSFC